MNAAKATKETWHEDRLDLIDRVTREQATHAEVIAECERLGIDVETIAPDVELKGQRIVWRDRLDAQPKHEKARAANVREQEQDNQRLAAAREARRRQDAQEAAEHAARKHERDAEHSELTDRIRESQDARESLIANCQRPELVERLTNLRAEQSAATNTLTTARDSIPAEIATWRKRRETAEATIEKATEDLKPKKHWGAPGTPAYERLLRDDAEAQRQAAKTLESATRTVENAKMQIRKLEDRLADIEGTMGENLACLALQIENTIAEMLVP